MNKTKKRALLSAIAMLVVSAVVLSSATFAWFVAGDTANITGITATIDSGSSVQVSSSPTGPWQSTIALPALNGYKPAELLAVSTGPTISGSTFFKGELDSDGNFTSTELSDSLESLGSRVVKFTVYVKSSSSGDVKLTGSTFDAETLDNAVFCAIVDGATTTIYGANNTATSDAYEGIITEFVAKEDVPASIDEIITEDEINPVPAAGTALEAVSTVGDIEDHVVNFATDGAVKTLTFYVWLEGQQADCTGSKSATMTMGITFNKPE